MPNDVQAQRWEKHNVVQVIREAGLVSEEARHERCRAFSSLSCVESASEVRCVRAFCSDSRRKSSDVTHQETSVMPPDTLPPWTTSVLLIDGNHSERAFYADGLKRCSPDYLIQEATDGPSGLDLYRQTRRIDCVVLELALPRRSGLALLVDLLPIPSRPNVAVIVLTQLGYFGLWDLAKQNGVHACYLKQHTLIADLDRAIQRAVALVGLIPKEDRHLPI
jgi:CheY-like chemotaxis protein